MSTPSIWALRVRDLVNAHITIRDFRPDVSTMRVDESLLYFATVKASHQFNTTDEVPNEPWLASLMLHRILGDTSSGESYEAWRIERAKDCIARAKGDGWEMEDMLQAIEWCKTYHPHYPTSEQWSQVFDVSKLLIEGAQSALVDEMVGAFDEDEQQTWKMACDLDIPFAHWVERWSHQNPGEIALPELDINTL